MNHQPTAQIVQIIPAGGWRWKIRGESESYPLAAWALVATDYHDGQPPEVTFEGIDPNCEGLYGRVNDIPLSFGSQPDGGWLDVEYLPPVDVQLACQDSREQVEPPESDRAKIEELRRRLGLAE